MQDDLQARGSAPILAEWRRQLISGGGMFEVPSVRCRRTSELSIPDTGTTVSWRPSSQNRVHPGKGFPERLDRTSGDV